MSEVTMTDLVSLCKRRGIVFPGSDIYGGLANSWDYGHLGVEIKNNIKSHWWKSFVHGHEDVIGLDSAILMNPEVWKASGHVDGFSDPLMDCKSCKSRHRADKLIEEALEKKGTPSQVEGLDFSKLRKMVDDLQIKCPKCGNADFTDIRSFNLMFKTFQGVTDDSSSVIYLRPETAQGIFVNFTQSQTVSRKKLPFGIAQIGKSFRNEITPGNFIFRTREFEQMELEYFCFPEESLDQHKYWIEYCASWLKGIGVREDLFRAREHSQEELSHYSQATTDIEFKFPFGWGELWGIAHRGDFDLSSHMSRSGKDLSYSEPDKKLKLVPHVIEPSLGVDRLLLAILASAYEKDVIDGEERVVLKLHPVVAPFKACVLPLSKKLGDSARNVFRDLQKRFNMDYDDAGSIGKRYRRQDEAGTPYCVTYDFDSESDSKVTVRDRNSTRQERISIDSLKNWLSGKLEN